MQSKWRLLVMDCDHQVFVSIAQIVHMIHAILSLSHHHHHLLLAATLHMGHHHRRHHCLPTLRMEHHLHQQLKAVAH